MPRRLTEQDKDEMERRYLAGESRWSIAKAMGSKPPTITRVLVARGVPLRPIHSRKFSPEQECEIADRYAAGESMDALIAAYNTSAGTIRKIVKRKGGQQRLRGGRERIFTDAEIEEIRQLSDKRWSQTRIAAHLHTTLDAINSLARAHGITPAFASAARGEQHGSWKGGRTIDSGGYVRVLLSPDDPYRAMATSNGYVLEHRLVMARYLGRPLYAWETVHHIDDHDKTINDISNLQLRIGKHGKYAAYRCMDCGSTRLEPILLE